MRAFDSPSLPLARMLADCEGIDAVNAAIEDRISRQGPIPFSTFMDLALSGAEGFFATGRGAGRAGRDFLTSPEAGVLFGELVARALDGWWRELGEPDPFVVIEAGAGRGRLAADVLRSAPACGPALRYVLVERSPLLRAAHVELVEVEPLADALGPVPAGGAEDEPPRPVPGVGPIVASLPELPAGEWSGVVLANELLDNLPVDIVERAPGGWQEIRVGSDGVTLVEVPVPAADDLGIAADRVAAGTTVPIGSRLPVPNALAGWLEEAAGCLERGFLVAIDYAATADELVARGQSGWLRTYREHQSGLSPLAAPGQQDITCDVPVEALLDHASHAGFTPARHLTQAEWLGELGIDELVVAARGAWADHAAAGDLDALVARSRVHEADALTDPTGLGAHHVFVLTR